VESLLQRAASVLLSDETLVLLQANLTVYETTKLCDTEAKCIREHRPNKHASRHFSDMDEREEEKVESLAFIRASSYTWKHRQ
jgi:divalent metal cation (Fe/Co/Zn/Cd) transporter